MTSTNSTPLFVRVWSVEVAVEQQMRRRQNVVNPPLSGLAAVAHPGAAIAAPTPGPTITEDSFCDGSMCLAPIGAGPAPLTSPERGGSAGSGFSMQLKLVHPDHLRDGRELRVAIGRKHLVKLFAGDSRVAGHLTHAPSARTRSRGHANQAAVARVPERKAVKAGLELRLRLSVLEPV